MPVQFRYRFETHGERLYGFFRQRLAEGFPRDEFMEWLEPSGSATEWTEYVEQLTAVGLTGRVVTAGRSLEKQNSNDRPRYLREYRTYIRTYLGIDRDDALDEALSYAVPSVSVADGKIPEGLRKDRRKWAAKRHKGCYLCATPMDFEDEESEAYCTLEHLWPSSYGGNSIEENLLPACAFCNRTRKANFCTWASTSVQSVMRGLNPDLAHPHVLTGPARFALHHWAGQRYAIKHKTNLREAFLRLGAWINPRVVDPSDIAHFFNLRNHTATAGVD